MEGLAATFDRLKPRRLDHTHAPRESYVESTLFDLRSDSDKLARIIESETESKRIVGRIVKATDNVFEILNGIQDKPQLIFTGASSSISHDLLALRTPMLEQYPDVAELLATSRQLNSDQNMQFRNRGNLGGWFLGLPGNAVIVDEFANNMVKAHQLLHGRLNKRKMVVFALSDKYQSSPDVEEDLKKFHNSSFFYGLNDDDLANFLHRYATVTSKVAHINGHFGVAKNSKDRKYRWDRSKFTPEYEAIISQAEGILGTWHQRLAHDLSQPKSQDSAFG